MADLPEQLRCAARPGWRRLAISIAVGTAALIGGCVALPTNPSFPASAESAEADLRRMEFHPRAVDRPLVVIGGIMDPGVAANWMRTKFQSITGDRRIVAVPLGDCMSFAACRRRIVGAVQAAFPSETNEETIEVDVVGYSLGGVAARYAALNEGGGRRLRIARLFTISSPHRGAAVAQELPLIHPLQADLRPGSALLKKLNAHPPPYAIYPYVRLGDREIGQANAAPPGQTAWWVPTAPLGSPHSGAFCDARIIADIARRLRNEPPAALSPPATLPAAQ